MKLNLSSSEVTVMMPTFNAVQYVDAAILSVLSQEHRDWLLLAYDDHSDDGTYERLLFWESQDERIKAVRPFSSHGHYTDICNQMITDARTEYLARMDADDITLPKRLSLELSFLKRKSATVLVGGMALSIMMDDQGNRIVDNYPWIEKLVKPIASEQVPVNEHLKSFNRMVHSSILARKADIVQAGGYDDLFPLEDWDLALKLAAKGEVYILPNILMLKRQHKQNYSKAHPNLKQAFEIVKVRHCLEIDQLPKISQL